MKTNSTCYIIEDWSFDLHFPLSFCIRKWRIFRHEALHFSFFVLSSLLSYDFHLSFRCQCELCNDENLVGVREFRCCREVANASAKMTFDGSIERISCITQHGDYVALTNRTVLLQVAPLLRDKDGRTYRRRTGVPENEWVSAMIRFFAVAIRTAPVRGYQFAIRTGVHKNFYVITYFYAYYIYILLA